MVEKLTPVIFVSHGSPMMGFKESDSTKVWEEFGKEALANNIKGVVYIGAHWEVLDDRIQIATKPDPRKLQMDIIPKERYENYPVNISLELAQRVSKALKSHGFANVEEDPNFDVHDDLCIPSLWMFEKGTPPATVISLNARYDAAFHMRIGKALSELRREGILIICSGGAVHNLYRNNWWRMFMGGFDNFQVGSKPPAWATEFAQTVGDVIANNKGDDLAGALTRLTESHQYKDAHPTDDHYYPLLVAAGLVAESGEQGKHMARTWELTCMCNDQFVWGEWQNSAVKQVSVA